MEPTAYRPSKESRAFDSHRAASHPPTASFIRARAARADLSQEEPIPLFLSDPLGAPDPSEYTPVKLRSRVVPRVLAASTLAILAVLFQSDFRGLVTANGWAGVAPELAMASGDAPAIQSPLRKDLASVTNTTLASADSKDLPAPPVPSREAIATAYQIALQAQGSTQTPVQAPAPVAAQPAPHEPVRTLDADLLAGLMTRAKSLLSVGDIAAARLLLERAANSQDATAAFLLAQTYDPAVLGGSDVRSVTADAAAARDWYQRAAALGSAEARQRLAQLTN